MSTYDQNISKITLGRSHAAEQAKEEEPDRTQDEIGSFLESCNAIPCPIEAYAIWLAAWIAQGGQIAGYSSHNFVDSGDKWMMPTRTTSRRIPTAYGARALNLVVLHDFASVPLNATSGDRREGWEWGHSQVHSLTTRSSIPFATTNESEEVISYPDVRQYIRSAGKDFLELYARVAISRNTPSLAFLREIER